MTNQNIVIGIDFGTTQSTACFIDTQKKSTELILDSTGSNQYASMLNFSKGRNNTLVQFGNVVKNNPSMQSIIQEVKRFIGKEFSEMEETAERLGMMIEEGENGECIFIVPDPESEEDLRFTAEELVAIELRHIKEIICERCKDADFSKVVMTVPSSFQEQQTTAMKFAFELAGIKPLTTMKEPSAALNQFRYMNEKRNIKRALVIDIGGGTTDVCVCEPVGKRVNIKGNGGDSMLGGSDFDEIIMNMIISEMESSGYQNMHLFRKQNGEVNKMKKERMKCMNKLKQEAERAKIYLSTHKNYEVALEKILPRGDDFDADITISRAEFEEKIKESGLLERIEECIDNCLKNAKTRANVIDTVILVGGVTMMPIVREMIEKKFGKDKIVNNEECNPLHAVAKGAARYAYTYCAGDIVGGVIIENIVETIGLELLGGGMKVIAKEGTETPIRDWNHVFTTSSDYQTSIEFVLLKGDNLYAMDNEFLAEYTITNLPKKPKGQVQVELHIDIEQSGNMIMKAFERGSNQQGVEKRVSCGFNQTDEKFRESLDKIEPFCPQ